jgi:hypothetical protein
MRNRGYISRKEIIEYMPNDLLGSGGLRELRANAYMEKRPCVCLFERKDEDAVLCRLESNTRVPRVEIV